MVPVVVYCLCVLSGICLYAGFNHLQITLERPDRRAHQIFALMCFTAAVGALLTISVRWVDSPEAIVTGVRRMLAVSCVLGVLSPWLVAAYTRAESRLIPALLSTGYVVLFFANLLLPYGLWLSEPPPPDSTQWTATQRVTALMHDIGPWKLAWWSTHLLTFAYTFMRGYHQYRRGERYRAVALIVSCTLLMSSLVNNVLIAVGLSPLPYLGHVGFLGLIVLMSFSLGRDVRRSDRRMRTVLDLVPALTYVKDRSGRLLFANRHLRQRFGLSDAGELKAGLQADALHPAWQTHDTQVFAENRPCVFEETLQADGVVRSYVSLKFPLTDKRGRPDAIGSVSTDITEQKRVQHALAVREAELRLLIDSTEQGILGIDLRGRCTLVNRTCLTMMGYDDSRALLGKRVARLLLHMGPNVTQSQEIFIAVKGALERGERSHSAELKCYRTDGSWFHAEYWCQPILNSGQIEGAVISILDITERRRIADAILALAQASATADSEAFFKYCVRSLAQLYEVRYSVIGVLDPGGTRLRSLAIWAGDRIVENREFELAHSPCENMQTLSRRLISEGVARLFPNDVLLAQANIESYFVTPIVASNGRTIGALVLLGQEPLQVGPASESIVDIFANRISVELERQAALQEVGELNASVERRVAERTVELSRINGELEAFSYSVSHDLRAPLTAIHGFGSLLLKHYSGALDHSGLLYLRRIIEGSQRMGELIDGLLALAHIARQPLQHHPVDLAALADDSLRLLQEQHPQRRVRCDIEPALLVWGDRRLFKILVHNLLGNAWKYTSHSEHAHIVIGNVRHENQTAFYVRDNGVGFDPAQADRLFQPFRRLHADKQFQGMGIGLATVARIVDRHGGRIWAESRPGHGATFYFTLPEAPHPLPQRQSVSAEPNLDAAWR